MGAWWLALVELQALTGKRDAKSNKHQNCLAMCGSVSSPIDGPPVDMV